MKDMLLSLQLGSTRLPPVPAPPTCLYLWFTPDSAPGAHLGAVLGELGLPAAPHGDAGCMCVGPLGAELTHAITAIGDRLSGADALAIKALTLPDRQEPTMQDLPSVVPLKALIAEHQVRWLSQAMRFKSHYQPIVQARDTRNIFGYEALLRAYDAEGQFVPPARLFSSAREAKMLDVLDRGARTAAVETLEGKPIKGSLFINCSPSALEDTESFLDATLELLTEHQLSPSRIVLEIVELEQIRNLDLFKRHLLQYRHQGFRIALDDVGSGYSSLNLIPHLRPDFVKIDMELVRGVHQDRYKAAVTGNVLMLCRDLGIKTIAEGVEELGELHWLQENRADLVQGYLIGKPTYPPDTETPDLGSVSPERMETLVPLRRHRRTRA